MRIYNFEDQMTAEELQLPAHLRLCAYNPAEIRRLTVEREEVLSRMRDLAYDENVEDERAMLWLDEQCNALCIALEVVSHDYGVINMLTGRWHESVADYHKFWEEVSR